MAITVVNTIYNPITGVFGSGNVMTWVGVTAASGAQSATTYTWTVPAGVDAVRARVWGGGGYNGGSGGGFAIRAIYGLSGVTSITVTLGYGGNATTTSGGTSSFGSYVSATGGATQGGTAGAGSGGDINTTGGVGFYSGATNNPGGGVASIFGNGGSAISIVNSQSSFGGAGAASDNTGWNASPNGFIGRGALINNNTTAPLVATVIQVPSNGLQRFSIDFIGTGGGGARGTNGVNGGGGANNGGGTIGGGIPGGGGGGTSLGAPGMVIVEW